MTVRQDDGEVREFARYLRELVTLLDPGSGWYGTFCRGDPAGMRACLDGAEIPPWDVMESLLQDLAVLRGTAFARRESVRAAALYSSSVAAHDRRPGGRRALVERLELMRREQAHAARRLRDAGAGGARGAVIPYADAEAVARARDDHERATARCSELRLRMAAVATEVPEASAVPGVPEVSVVPEVPEAVDRAGEGGPPPRGPDALPSGPRQPAPGRRKPRGARFAGLDMDDTDDTPVQPAPAPSLPPTTAAAPRGARFAAAPARGDTPSGAATRAPVPAPETRRAAARAVERLVRLRAAGRSGEAHAVLCEAARWPAERLPVLADELYRTGLDADWATLLWEVSSLPPAQLASAAAALHAAGRPGDCGRLLRQGVARPPGEIADAAVALERAGRGVQAEALLDAFVRVRTPQDVARVAVGDPHRLVPRLLAVARAVSPARERDVVHALRVAGVVGAP
ncbi:hypothetical protein ACFU98_30380 [Streptomyces sp. NPDC057575]|uniref:hypothetical protein n=1 Tax=unclassified Streptomyces TaxID=2593676 RepID=UPI0036BD6697